MGVVVDPRRLEPSVLEKKWRPVGNTNISGVVVMNLTRTMSLKEDVTGAPFKGQNPRSFHCDQLRRWLKCRGASTTGNKIALLER